MVSSTPVAWGRSQALASSVSMCTSSFQSGLVRTSRPLQGGGAGAFDLQVHAVQVLDAVVGGVAVAHVDVPLSADDALV